MLNHISHVDIIVFVIVLIELDVVNFVIVGVGFVTVDFGVAVAVTNVLLLHFSSDPLGSSGSVLRISVAVRLNVARFAT